jgi:hypothetical protein
MQFSLSLDPAFPETPTTPAIASIGVVRASCEEDGVYYVCVDNLLSDTTYYWKVDDMSGNCEIRSFTTLPDETRTICAEGSANIRDIGGRRTKDGRKIRQGLLYRGGQLSNFCIFQYELTENGRKVLCKDLGIRTEIELRQEIADCGVTESSLGEDVRYYCLPIWGYTALLRENFNDTLIKIFTVIADESAYPMYIHCTAGADRTGSIAMFLQGILNVPEEDIRLDYDFTALSVLDLRSWGAYGIQEFLSTLDQLYPGHTFGEQMVLHLKKIGISEETMEKIRSIFLQ